jgi:hypothetical protein
MGLIYIPILNNNNLFFYYFFILLSFVVRLGLAVNSNLSRNFKTGGFFRLTQIFPSFTYYICTDIFNRETFCYGGVLLRRRFVTGDVLLRRRYVTETLCYGDVLYGDVLYGDVLSRRRFVRIRFVCAPLTIVNF